MERFAVLRPHIEEGIPLVESARAAGVPIRTMLRWRARFDAEGLALRQPRLSNAAIHRQAANIAEQNGWSVPSNSTVYAIIRALDPAVVTLAQDGAAAYRDRFELIHRHRAETPNGLWQTDHTLLDVLILDANGTLVRPWLSVIMDDHSCAIARDPGVPGCAVGPANITGSQTRHFGSTTDGCRISL